MCKTGLNGVCKWWNWKVRTVGNITWRPIDSSVTNARKLLEVRQHESLYQERTWKIFVERYKEIKEEWKDICNGFC